MNERTVRLTVHWPSGGILPIRIDRDEGISSLVRLLDLLADSKRVQHLVYRNSVINMQDSISSAGIDMDSDLYVVFESESVDYEFEYVTNESGRLHDVFLESLRLHDIQLDKYDSMIHSHRDIKVFDVGDNFSPFSPSFEHTRIPEKAIMIRGDPLPKFWSTHGIDDRDSASDDGSDQDSFSSLEDANSFISKENWHGWIW